VLTRLLVAINVVAYAWEQLTGAFTSNATLIAHGGLVGSYVLQNGEWWRILSSGFLHGSLMHLAFNMFALWQVGTFVEIIYGTPRMAVIYFVAMFAGGVAVTYFDPNVVTVGASGAIFGLFGALAIAGFRMGERGRDIMRQTTGIIVINLVISFLPGTNISIEDHIGGLICGTICGLLLFRVPRQYAAVAAESDGAGYAQRIDAYADPGVVTIEHAPIAEEPTPTPPPA
jgi:membrane associated rhomboid family serine protease